MIHVNLTIYEKGLTPDEWKLVRWVWKSGDSICLQAMAILREEINNGH